MVFSGFWRGPEEGGLEGSAWLIRASPRFGGFNVFVGLLFFWLFGGGPEEGPSLTYLEILGFWGGEILGFVSFGLFGVLGWAGDAPPQNPQKPKTQKAQNLTPPKKPRISKYVRENERKEEKEINWR